MQAFNAPESLALIAAPMVNQSDLPFRLLTRRHGATLAYTQMLSPHLLLNDKDYLEFHLRDIRAEFDGNTGLERPVVVQLHGNDPETLVKAARVVQTSCDAIGGYSTHYESSKPAQSHKLSKHFRSQSRMSPGARQGRSLWGVPLGKGRLAACREDRCVEFVKYIYSDLFTDLLQSQACHIRFQSRSLPRFASANHPL